MEERDIEMAEKLVEQERESSLALVRSSLEPEYHPDFDGESCVACGNPVGSERLDMGRIRCVECQTVREQKRSRGIWVEPDPPRPRPKLSLPEFSDEA